MILFKKFAICSFLLIIVSIQYFNLWRLTSYEKLTKLGILNSALIDSNQFIFFTSFIESDKDTRFVWLADGSEIITIFSELEVKKSNIKLNFSANPCKVFNPLILELNSSHVVQISKPGLIEINLDPVIYNYIRIHPSSEVFPCQVNGDPRDFYGKIIL
jgi:hypothetical protein